MSTESIYSSLPIAPAPIYTPAPASVYPTAAPVVYPTTMPVYTAPMYQSPSPSVLMYPSQPAPALTPTPKPTNYVARIILFCVVVVCLALLGYTIYYVYQNYSQTITNWISGNKTEPNTNINISTNTNINQNTSTCKNGVYNDATNICMCSGNWSGEQCNQCGLVCSNGGILDPNECVCKCNDGYVGKTCEISLNNIN